MPICALAAPLHAAHTWERAPKARGSPPPGCLCLCVERALSLSSCSGLAGCRHVLPPWDVALAVFVRLNFLAFKSPLEPQCLWVLGGSAQASKMSWKRPCGGTHHGLISGYGNLAPGPRPLSRELTPSSGRLRKGRWWTSRRRLRRPSCVGCSPRRNPRIESPLRGTCGIAPSFAHTCPHRGLHARPARSTLWYATWQLTADAVGKPVSSLLDGPGADKCAGRMLMEQFAARDAASQRCANVRTDGTVVRHTVSLVRATNGLLSISSDMDTPRDASQHRVDDGHASLLDASARIAAKSIGAARDKPPSRLHRRRDRSAPKPKTN
jgi:hypothetical protein